MKTACRIGRATSGNAGFKIVLNRTTLSALLESKEGYLCIHEVDYRSTASA
jgi:hypothetical protein